MLFRKTEKVSRPEGAAESPPAGKGSCPGGLWPEQPRPVWKLVGVEAPPTFPGREGTGEKLPRSGNLQGKRKPACREGQGGRKLTSFGEPADRRKTGSRAAKEGSARLGNLFQKKSKKFVETVDFKFQVWYYI